LGSGLLHPHASAKKQRKDENKSESIIKKGIQNDRKDPGEIISGVKEEVMAMNFHAGTVKKAISYFYLLSFCPPANLEDFTKASEGLRKQLAEEAGLSQNEFFSEMIPQVCWRIVAFSQSSREPDKELVDLLSKLAESAAQNPESLIAFQAQMLELAALPGRAKADNRLHRKKGCRFCEAPCRYGYFSLVSEPKFYLLQQILEAETKKEKGEQNPIRAVWSFAISHLTSLMSTEQGYISAQHLGNLAYCLLMLSMAKSRYPLPEKQITAFQQANQRIIQTWPV
jgi:hypothetical protein